jgi:hypothetical protein
MSDLRRALDAVRYAGETLAGYGLPTDGVITTDMLAAAGRKYGLDNPGTTPDSALEAVMDMVARHRSLVSFRPVVSHPRPRLCAHADDEGRGMHVLQPGEQCSSAPIPVHRGDTVTELRYTPLRHKVLDALSKGRQDRSSTPAQISRAENSLYEAGLVSGTPIEPTEKGYRVLYLWNTKHGRVGL